MQSDRWRLDKEKEKVRTFELRKEQTEFLREKYPNEPIVKKVLSCEHNGVFEVDIDTKIEFMDFVEDESVFCMDESYGATKETTMLESIRDDIYYQTN